MRFNDTILLDGVRRTSDGFLTANARVARTGIQIYTGAEVGKPELKSVRVYRPEAEVFSVDALHSFAHRPVTLNHPNEAVTAENWKKLAVGQTGEGVLRDGEFIMVPLVLMDATAIKEVEAGKRELSMGYDTTIRFADGHTPSGEAYDAIQTEIRANHLAVVATARGGPDLRIGDNGEKEMTELRKVMVDGLQVETTEAGAAAIAKLQSDAKASGDASRAALDAANVKIVDLTKAVETKTGEVAALTSKLKDAELTPAKVDAAVVARAKVIGDAKKIAGDKLAIDGKTDAEIRRAAVAAKLGDEPAKAMSDASIEGAFAALATDTSGKQPDALSAVLGDVSLTDMRSAGDAAWKKSVEETRDAWKGPSAKAA